MNLFDILSKLEEFLPILSTIAGHPELAALAARLVAIAEEEVQRRQSTTGRTRTEILADAQAAYVEAKDENDKLKALGH